MPLYPIDELPDLMVDACLCDEQRQLVFMSAWGRDTAVQEFLARLTLGHSDNGLTQFHINVEGRPFPVFPNLDLLEKRTTRQLPGTLFGSLIHVWLFDRRAAVPDLANHVAFALMERQADPWERAWPLVVATCPLPLLPHWRLPVMQLLTHHDMLTSLPVPIGNTRAWRVALQLDVLEVELGKLIRCNTLTTVDPASS